MWTSYWYLLCVCVFCVDSHFPWLTKLLTHVEKKNGKWIFSLHSFAMCFFMCIRNKTIKVIFIRMPVSLKIMEVRKMPVQFVVLYCFAVLGTPIFFLRYFFFSEEQIKYVWFVSTFCINGTVATLKCTRYFHCVCDAWNVVRRQWVPLFFSARSFVFARVGLWENFNLEFFHLTRYAIHSSISQCYRNFCDVFIIFLVWLILKNWIHTSMARATNDGIWVKSENLMQQPQPVDWVIAPTISYSWALFPIY